MMTRTAESRRERDYASANGYAMALLGAAVLLGGAGAPIGARGPGMALFALELTTIVFGVLFLAGLFMLQPNEAAILTLFGAYAGTDRPEGLRWADPFFKKRHLSLRARNLNAPTLKVNDKRGNPVEISAVVVWRVRDTAAAAFDVDNYGRYVAVQAEAAIRRLATQFAYDDGEDLAPRGDDAARRQRRRRRAEATRPGPW
jgi:hypothetical protein